MSIFPESTQRPEPRKPGPPVRYVVEYWLPGPAATAWTAGTPLKHRTAALEVMRLEALRHPDRYGPDGWSRLRVRRIGGQQ